MGLDTVEIVLGWERAFGLNLSDDEVITLRTPAMAIDLISLKLKASDDFAGVCLELRAYQRIRQAFCNVLKIPRQKIQLDTKLRELIPKNQRREVWQEICSHADLPEVPPFGFAVGFFFMPITIGDLVKWAVAHCPCNVIYTNERWTKLQVRSVVRAVISDVLGTEEFKDEDDFVRDIGAG
jgi:acyl carrier protein